MAEPKKVVFSLCIHDGKGKTNAMKAIASVKGIDSMNIDMNDNKLTVVGVFDRLCCHKRLTRVCKTEIFSLEIVKDEEKKEEPKKEEPKTEEPKKEDEKKDQNEYIKVWPYEPYYPYMSQHYVVTMDEQHPNCCVIS